MVPGRGGRPGRMAILEEIFGVHAAVDLRRAGVLGAGDVSLGGNPVVFHEPLADLVRTTKEPS